MTRFRALLVLIALFLSAQTAAAQNVQLRGHGTVEDDEYLRQLIDAGGYTLVTQDTEIAASETVQGTILIAGATLRLDGTVTGDIVVVGGNLFLRPTARVLGHVRNIAGGFYPSDLASVSGRVANTPNAPYEVQVNADGSVVITGTTQRSPLVLYGISGVLPPTYDRVDGLTLSLNAGYMLPRLGLIEPIVRARVDYRSQRGAFTGGAELAAARRNTELAVGVDRTTLTNEEWVRSTLNNSVSALVLGKDVRGYHEADLGYVELRRLLEEGPRTSRAWLRAQVEDARSLPQGSPWSLFGDLGDPEKQNMAIDDGRIASVILGGDVEWVTLTHALEVEGLIESAFDGPAGFGSFNRFAADADWAMPALANHTLELEIHVQGPLPGTTSLPRQRWSAVGGSGTLHTFELAEFRGDRVVMVETDYVIPLPEWSRVRLLGLPTFDLLHLIGMAWTADEKRGFEQNIGVRLRFNVANLRVVTNPENFADDIKFSVGVSLPRTVFPWQVR